VKMGLSQKAKTEEKLNVNAMPMSTVNCLNITDRVGLLRVR